jgi:hypothetical protein
VRFAVRQIIDLIPKIYDTERIARIIGEDGQTSHVKINPDQQQPVNSIHDQMGVEIEKIYNPNIGKYDVMITTGPNYMTKRQEALESMGQLLQGNPDLWKVAGDLFVKHMDWPGAQEMAKRLAKTIDPKFLSDDDKPPALQAAEQQIQAMGQEMEQMHQMLQNVNKSIEMQEQRRKDYEAEIKAYQAETQRIAAVQNSLGEEQISDIVMGTLHAAMATGDIGGGMPQPREVMPMEQGMEPMQPPMQPPMQQGMEPMQQGTEQPPMEAMQ